MGCLPRTEGLTVEDQLSVILDALPLRKSGDVKGTIRNDMQYLMVSRDVRRHRLISISYISLLPCHGRGRGFEFRCPRHFFSHFHITIGHSRDAWSVHFVRAVHAVCGDVVLLVRSPAEKASCSEPSPWTEPLFWDKRKWHTLQGKELQVARRRKGRYPNEFRRMAVERLKRCENIVALSEDYVPTCQINKMRNAQCLCGPLAFCIYCADCPRRPNCSYSVRTAQKLRLFRALVRSAKFPQRNLSRSLAQNILTASRRTQKGPREQSTPRMPGWRHHERLAEVTWFSVVRTVATLRQIRVSL